MLLGANFAWAKKRGGIPADCYEVEYLRGDGNSYINLGTPIPSGYWHKAKFKFTNTDTSYRAIIGARQASMVKDYQTTLSSGNLLIRYGTPTDQFWQKIAIDDVHTLELTSNREVILDGVTLKTIGYSEPNPSINIYVMAVNQNGSAIQIFGNGDYLYSIEVGSGSSKLYDLVPVRRVENGVSVGYLCDKLTGTLYGNAGTGAFVIGPDKYDAEVEYLESTGTQWVETNQPADPRNLPLEIGFSAIDNKYVIGGGPSSSEGFGISVVSSSGTSVSVKFGWNTNLYYWNNERTTPYHITGVSLVDGSYRYRLNERQGNGVTAGTYDDTMVLFGRKVGSSVEPSAVRIYYAKVGSCDFIPVRYRDVGYLYDKVSGRLFGNQGSGEFVIGADVKYAKDYGI